MLQWLFVAAVAEVRRSQRETEVNFRTVQLENAADG